MLFTQVDGAHTRLVRLAPDGTLTVLTGALADARDPNVSFDGRHVLFSGKSQPGDRWQIFEMNADGGEVRQVTREPMDCRNPFYQSTFYVITAGEPWRQIGFTGTL